MTLGDALSRLLGERVRVAEARFAEVAEPSDDDALLEATAGESRRQAFRAGRLAARRALAMLDSDAPRIPIGIGALGEPLFPTDFTGSISHSKERAVAIVGRRDAVRHIGVDMERKRILGARVLRRVSIPAERERLTLDEHGLVLFSAKESIYKALSPEVRRWFGFGAVDLAVHNDGTFVGTLTGDLCEAWEAGARVSGVWCEDDSFVATACVLWR